MNTKASEQVVKIEEQNLTRIVDSFIFRRNSLIDFRLSL